MEKIMPLFIERALSKHDTIFLFYFCEIHGSVEIQIVNIIVRIGPLDESFAFSNATCTYMYTCIYKILTTHIKFVLKYYIYM